MSVVHPSRMNLIPASTKDSSRQPVGRGRSPSPSSRRRYRSRSGDSRERSHSPRDKGRERDTRDREEDRKRYGSKRRSHSQEGDRYRSGGGGGARRASPDYDSYRRDAGRPADPVPESAPWRRNENMDKQGGGGGGYYGNVDLESRRAQREAMTVNIWPESPKAPARDLSPKRGKSSKRSRRDPSSDDSSSEEERRRERKERKRAKKEKERREKEKKKESRSSRRSRSPDEDSDRDRRRHHRERSKSEDVKAQRRDEDPRSEDEWIVKDGLGVPASSDARGGQGHEESPPLSAPMDEDDEDDEALGPQPMAKANSKKVDERSYGGALLRGEGSAMAAFLQEDPKARIPRRGEIGLTSDQIEAYENVGYVMSGSRHRRMNAVRMRKENQVISAEEKRGILKLQAEERARREAILREEFGELVAEKLKQTK